MKTYTYQVVGRGEFPWDMLRYDCAYPASEDDAYKMNKLGERTVTLRTHVQPISAVRWSSFCWQLLK